MLSYYANLKAIRYESTRLKRIVSDKSHRVIVALGVLQLSNYDFKLSNIGYKCAQESLMGPTHAWALEKANIAPF